MKLDKEKIIPLTIFLSALVIRLSLISQRPLDGDEGVIIDLVKDNLTALWRNFTLDVHPPFYQFFVWLSIHTFGVSELSLRLVSVIAGALIPLAVYYFAKDYFDRKVVAVSVLLSTFSPYLIYQAQEARMYAVFTLLILLSVMFWARFLRSKDIKIGFVWILCGLAVAWTQHLGLVIFAVQFIVLLSRDFTKRIKAYYPLILTALVLYLPLISKTYTQTVGRLSEQPENIFSKNIVGIVNAYYRFGAGRTFLALEPSPAYYLQMASQSPMRLILFIVGFIVPLGLFILGLKKLFNKDKKLFWQLSLMPIVLVLIASISGEIGPRATRYLAPIAPFYFIIVALGWLGIKSRYIKYLSGLLMVIVIIFGLKAHFDRDLQAPGAREIAQFLAKNAQSGDAVLAKGSFLHGESTILNYYLDKVPDHPDLKVVDFFGVYQLGNLNQIKALDVGQTIDELLKTSSRVWYYDFSYSKTPDYGKVFNLGLDKEGQEIRVQEITK